MTGDEAKRAGGQPDRDVAVSVLVVEYGAIQRDRGIGTERQIGAVEHYQPRRAVEAGVHGFVAQHAVADIDLAASRSRDTDDFILDHGRLADAGLRPAGLARAPPTGPARRDGERRDANSFHYRSIDPIPYRIAHACVVAEIQQTAPHLPDG